jgi:hypothetical protein
VLQSSITVDLNALILSVQVSVFRNLWRLTLQQIPVQAAELWSSYLSSLIVGMTGEIALRPEYPRLSPVAS